MSARALLRNRRDRFAGLEIRLKASKLANAQAQRNAIARDRERTQRLAERARRALATAMQRLEARVAHSGQLLAALSYRGVLARGFALVRDEQGHAVHAAAAVGPGAHLTHRIRRRPRRRHRGCRSAAGDDRRSQPQRRSQGCASASASPPRRSAWSKPVDQGSLF